MPNSINQLYPMTQAMMSLRCPVCLYSGVICSEIETETKWEPFCRHLKCVILIVLKMYIFHLDMTEVHSQWSNWPAPMLPLFIHTETRDQAPKCQILKMYMSNPEAPVGLWIGRWYIYQRPIQRPTGSSRVVNKIRPCHFSATFGSNFLPCVGFPM